MEFELFNKSIAVCINWKHVRSSNVLIDNVIRTVSEKVILSDSFVEKDNRRQKKRKCVSFFFALLRKAEASVLNISESERKGQYRSFELNNKWPRAQRTQKNSQAIRFTKDGAYPPLHGKGQP